VNLDRRALDALIADVDEHVPPAGEVLAHGVGTAPGTAAGVAVFSAADAVRVRAGGDHVVLLLRSSKPDDLAGLLASAATATERGGYSSHDSVVARGLGRPAMTALDATVVEGDRLLLAGGGTVLPGDVVSVDGHNGMLHAGGLGSVGTSSSARDDLRAALAEHHDAVGVRVNTEDPLAAAAALADGASGVGLLRVEHVFLGPRQRVLQRALISAPGPDRDEASREVEVVLRDLLVEVLAVMDGLPVAVRLLDPPRNEFLPDPVDLALSGAASGAEPDRAELLAVSRRLAEVNPSMGMRGVRLAVAVPELAEAQLRAIVEAAALLRRRGLDPRPQVLLPMVTVVEELTWVRALLGQVLAGPAGSCLSAGVPLGVMIETPRSALLAPALAAHADFLSIGSNDLTALTWGLSREDSEHSVLPAYRRAGLLGASPFRHLDTEGVGALVAQAVAAAKAARPGLQVGVCGEHAGDPRSAGFLVRAGVDYLSCSAPLVLTARAAAARDQTRG
jgi:pyruvate,orthophosphate dikinase